MIFATLQSPVVSLHARAIARDRLEPYSADFKTKALGYIDAVLEVWKLRHSDPDDVVDITPEGAVLMRRALGNLNDAELRRVAAVDLRPDQCAGPLVHCAVDLWLELRETKFGPVTEAEDILSLDLIMALLIERDGEAMPVESLAVAMHHIWNAAWATVIVHKEAVDQVIEKLVPRFAKRLAAVEIAQLASAEARSQKAAWDEAECRSIAVQTWQRELNADRSPLVDDVALLVRGELAKRRGEDAKLPKGGTIKNWIKGTKGVAVEQMTRASRRQTQ